MPSLSEDIASLLATDGPLRAQEIASRLRKRAWPGLDKSDVNRVVYSDSRFRTDERYGGNWSLAPTDRPASMPLSRETIATPSAPQIRLYRWQAEAHQAWVESGRIGIVEAVTGTGKTTVGVVAARECLGRGGQVLILVPTIELLRQWCQVLQNEIPNQKCGLIGDENRDGWRDARLLISVINSAASREDLAPHSRNSLLIADECHRYGTAAWANALRSRFGERLGLTATYERSDNGIEDHLEPYFGDVVYSYDFADARQDSVVAPFKVALIGAAFSPSERIRYSDASERARTARRKLITGYGVVESPFGEFMREVVRLSNSGTRGEGIAAGTYLKAFRDRAAVLAETQSKMDAVRGLVPLIAGRRTLLFTESIASAEGLTRLLTTEHIAASTVHSGVDPVDRRRRLNDFAEGRSRALVAPRVLDEGIDVPEADLGIVLATSHSRRQMIQRMGRVLRRKRDGRVAAFAIVFVEGTSEDPDEGAHEAFLEVAMEAASECQSFRGQNAASMARGFLS